MLVVQRATEPTLYPKGFHFGFLLPEVAAVHALHTLARADGVPVSDVIVNGRGTMIYFSAPEGYFIEVSCQRARPDQHLSKEKD